MSNLILNLAIDTSGQPYDKIFIGLISVKTDCLRIFEKEFRKRFPKFYRYKEKGTKRSASELKSIISFMNQKPYIKMYTLSFSKEEWNDFKLDYKGTSNLIEKTYALLYCYLFSRICWKYKPYNAIICEESYLNTDLLLNYCNQHNKFLKRTIILSKGNAESTFLIRLADFIAAAHRKVDYSFLKGLDKYFIYKTKDIDYRLVEKFFKK